MKYIELPPGVDVLQQDSEGYHYFKYQENTYYLHTIVATAEKEIFYGHNGLSLYVGERCPRKDVLYAEYLSREGQPASWCKIYNGIQKGKDIDRMMQAQSWIVTTPLSTSRREKAEDARQEQRDDRRQKGPKSI
ncbi:hypothetical protein [Legionella oakridgensis]|uniref:Uncharacterized protein n=2 Tax=Legionella oakridgensis TaxID=29423 RepID=W0BAR8_9GAMM|nr:hypothetical protein [Legionella oakridgensis]AHE65761.1 hypothetical protein Loa_00170 [Legionella oakridgensis ATCC 33761 = DSM 21215]ETO94410.1 hypothetical protein LOR_55c11950 [Legionella oakridgensis RV-2-2007]KTD38166.1 hypothetical protein Loak_1842 [Legionella oakridgensis]STY15704.1 Uncharacterised protein [Legionella longbeachae]